MANDPGITRETVEHLASLSRITLTDDETEMFTAQLGQILGAIAKVSEVAGEDVPATSHPVPLVNVMREDEVRDVLTQEQALKNAPESAEGKFQVTAILGEEQ
ncbi:Asp-tRNA(Asn)/Glu-tRNA(Gln) amidotransferase subunit GatC [Canibacter zhoujuaniae]|uniref:Asp-tRNA(Asn)/Glu-tRNA(Gln) amidotransferase subunit GatC n=1 Tax=Canibacter zhoujuaniae TaxID=2708343 RepID=UPI001421DE75|nr:Asp-tRNA(Asn)/Glu-tRNA(Gln) amidotransferase subunit GatC [Canibacter zhoujuaniae]